MARTNRSVARIIRFTTVGLMLGAVVVCALGASTDSAAWPQWRGADRLNASRETGLLKEWPTNGPPLLWRATGIGLGIHSVSVAGGRVFTSGNRDGGEFVFALDVRSGEKLWAARLDNAIEENALMRWLSQRCPTVDGDRVYAFTANGNLWCLRVADGEKVWQVPYSKEFGARRPGWGYCDHPLVHGELLIGAPFAADAAIAALNKHTGAVVWKTRLDQPLVAGYAALIGSRALGVAQVILFHGSGLAGFETEGGRLLWQYQRPNTRTASSYTPIPHDDVVISPNGYGGGLAVCKIVRSETGFATEQVSHLKMDFDPFQDSSAVVGDRIYLMERGRPVCLDAKTGAQVWSGGSTSRGPRSALTWADDHLYIRNNQGDVKLVQTMPEPNLEKGRFRIPEHEPSVGVTSPVVAESRLWLRDNNRLFCYDVSQAALTAGRSISRHTAIGLSDAELGLDSTAPRAPRIGVDRAPDAVFVPTPQDIVERMLETARVKKTDLLVDLGSGDGRFVLAAAKKYGCKAVGYEIDARLVQESRDSIARENLGALATIEHRDIFTLDLSGADVVTLFLYPGLMERLIPKFKQLKPGSRIVSHQFEMPGIAPDETVMVQSNEDGDHHRIFLWTTPLRPKPAP